MVNKNYSLKLENFQINQAQLSERLIYKDLTSISLEKIQQSILLSVDQNAPRFQSSQAPSQDNQIYTANDGQRYYRPIFRLAEREGQIPGPAVRFLKDADGNMRLHLELEETPSNFNDAQPFAVHVEALAVIWPAGRQTFPAPTIFFDQTVSSDRPRIIIRAGMDIPANQIEPLYQAMQQNAQLVLSLSYGYWLQEQPSQPTPPITPRPFPFPRPFPDGGFKLPQQQLVQYKFVQPVLANKALDRAGVVRRLNIPNVSADVLANSVKLEREQQAREQKQNYTKAAIQRTLSFVFDAGLRQNLPIYAAIRAGDDSLRAAWIDTEFGLIRQAEFANTVYRLPDEFRLAFNPELGLPYFIPQLYRDSEETVRVRVTLRVIPHHDPAKLSALRDFLYRDSAGGLANPSVIVGSYEKATLKLTTAFPEEISILEGSEADIALEGGVQMTLDLSLEYYRYLAELMTTSIGVTGEITVTLSPSSGEEAGLVKRIPMSLRLNALAGIALETKVFEETLSPHKIELTNATNATIEIGNCVPRLLQIDSNSIVPLAIFQASPTTAMPLVLAPAEKTVVEVQPVNLKDEVWNALHLTLLNPQLTQNATDVLERIHDVSPSGSLAWKISIECPLFKSASLPDALAGLYRVVVEISREGYAPQRVILGKETPENEVIMQRSLKEILGKNAAGLPVFNYRVQNIYFDREGAWSDYKAAEGNSLFIFPNRDEP